MRVRTVQVVAAGVAATIGAFALGPVQPVVAAGAGIDERSSDFNGDGFDDLALGGVGEDVEVYGDVGGVNVIYGSAGGLRAKGDQFWWPGSPGLVGEPMDESDFGIALCAHDFDGDGYDDLAVGAYTEDVGAASAAGTVRVLYGSPKGLTADRDQQWSLASDGIAGEPVSNDVLGWTVGAGDLDGDGFADLAIGMGGRHQVHVLRGSASGLTADRSAVLTAPAGAGWSGPLATGDLDGDGIDDLVWGQPWTGDDSGRVAIWFGVAEGVSGSPDVVVGQNTPGVVGTAGPEESFGSAIAVLDVDGDELDDVVVAARDGVGEEWRARRASVTLLRGAQDRQLTGSTQRRRVADVVDDSGGLRSQLWVELAGGDLDGDGSDDLVVGIPSADHRGTQGRLDRTGAVVVIPGDDGLGTQGFRLAQGADGIPDEPGISENFGVSAIVRDYDGNGVQDLAVASHENVYLGDPGSYASHAGGAVVSRSGGGWPLTGWSRWTQNTRGIEGISSSYDAFGFLDG